MVMSRVTYGTVNYGIQKTYYVSYRKLLLCNFRHKGFMKDCPDGKLTLEVSIIINVKYQSLRF